MHRVLVPLLALLILTVDAAMAQRLFRERRPAMGTTAELLLYAPSQEAAAPVFELVFGEIERVEQLLSDYRPSSELSRINASTGPVTLDPEMARLMNRILGWSRQSGGAFDPTVGPLMHAWGFGSGGPAVPSDSTLKTALAATGSEYVAFDVSTREVRFLVDGMRLDPGAFGKGYALDRAAQVLRDSGVQAALLGFGGSSYLALDAPPGQPGWLIHVDDPTAGGAHTTSVLLRNSALSTSGGSDKSFEARGKTYSHILDPRSGRPSEASIQVTVAASSAMDADILSTAAFVLGADGAFSLLGPLSDVRAWHIHPSPDGPAVRTIRWQNPEPGQTR